MSSFVAAVRKRANETFLQESFQWFDRSYLVDWAFATLAWILAWMIKGLPPFEREFSADDPLISHANRPNTIGGDLTWWLALLVPLGTIAVIGMLKVSAVEIHHGFLGLWAARGYNALVTEALKNRVAVSRVEDYRHHKEDVIVGSLIGIGAATVSYLIYWPSPFTLQGNDLQKGASRPRIVYRDSEQERTRHDYNYELAGMEHATEEV
ncbi:hypothetical protein EIP91_005517 [Steccherinum ochraceum]|uniref:Phosphatidic acid phosphatase type 2/haloperoxidase domain-containing protein n=1 Tax=Steccherinum ochraceum TaxID=92696 RepID=A0A4R0RSB6_9APHY|nr:hypothetical protein EIP91_005517 [Steccherinum ochraceum]